MSASTGKNISDPQHGLIDGYLDPETGAMSRQGRFLEIGD